MRARRSDLFLCGLVLSGFGLTGSIAAQQPPEPANQFSRRDTFTVFAEYSNTSSHILMGVARQRELAGLGFGYTRRLFGFWGSSLGYQVEVRPALFESDPVAIYTSTTTVLSGPSAGTYTNVQGFAILTPCRPSIGLPQTITSPGYPSETVSENVTCGRQWTITQEFSPAGLKYSMRTRHAVQPFVIGTAGYMYSSRPIPVAGAGSFNYTFDFGVGIEVFRSRGKSVSVETRYHHFANGEYTAYAYDSGVDNIMYKLSYSFGR